MTMLDIIESQRAIAVLQETVEKLEFLGTITPNVLTQRDELSKMVGDEISRLIEDQRTLEQRYEELIAQRAKLKGQLNKQKYKENQKEIQLTSQKLRESTKKSLSELKG